MSKNSKEKVRKTLKQEAKKIVHKTTDEIREAIDLINSNPRKKIKQQVG